MSATFSGSVFIPSSEMMCPKYFISFILKSQFLWFSLILLDLPFLCTRCRVLSWSSLFSSQTRMSPNITIAPCISSICWLVDFEQRRSNKYQINTTGMYQYCLDMNKNSNSLCLISWALKSRYVFSIICFQFDFALFYIQDIKAIFKCVTWAWAPVSSLHSMVIPFKFNISVHS